MKAFAKVIKKLDDVGVVVVEVDDGYVGKTEASTRALNIKDNVVIACSRVLKGNILGRKG